MVTMMLCFLLFSGRLTPTTTSEDCSLQSVASHDAHGRGLLQIEAISKHRRVAARAGIPEMLEEWEDSGKAMQSEMADDHLMRLSSQITTDVYSEKLHNLVDRVTSRYVADEGNSNTANYIKNEFKAMGLKVSSQKIVDSRIKDQFQSLSQQDAYESASHENLVGFRKGTDLAHEVIVLGAHYDSVNWEDTGRAAPGVDDNGSGTALMLAVAKILSSDMFTPRRSLMFVAFNAEEEGLVGSEHFVKLFKPEGEGTKQFGDLKAVFIADEVAWPGRGKERREAIFETHGHGDGTTAMVDTLARMASLTNTTSEAAGDGIGDGTHNFVVNYHGFGSDHMSFLAEGIPAVLLIEKDDDYHSNQWGHSDRDTFDNVDMSYGAAMTRLALRTVASFASPEHPLNRGGTGS